MATKPKSKDKSGSVAVRCRVVAHKNRAMLVQWDSDGMPTRAFITVDMVHDGSEDGDYVTVANPERGVPYGVNLGALVSLETTTDQLTVALRKRGIWTKKDVLAQPDQARGAIQDAFGVTLATLIDAVNRSDKGEE